MPCIWHVVPGRSPLPGGVRACRHTGCDLHTFRMGKGNRTMSEEQRTAAVERLAAYRTTGARPTA